MIMDRKPPRKPDYEVGYGKPPRANQFQPGKSGNPKGRPKGAHGMKTIMREKLKKKQAIKVNGKEQVGTRLENVFETLTLRAGAGDLKAQSKIIELYLMLFGPDDEGSENKRLSAHDQQLLEEWLKDVGASGKAAKENRVGDFDQPNGDANESDGNEGDLPDNDEEDDDGTAQD